MRKQLEAVYENLYDSYYFGFPPSQPFNLALINSIRNEISEVEQVQSEDNAFNRITIRSDAKYFLSVIFHQMVGLPLQLENRREIVEGIATLERDILHDIRYLLDEGYRRKEKAEIKEITAHTILTVMDEKWTALRIAKFELWNKK